jgi:hypothetical protein
MVTAEDKQRHYRHLRRRGISPKHARKLATGLYFAVGLSTSTSFMANRDDGFGVDDLSRRRHHAAARAAGINPTGKVWSPQLNEWYETKDDVRRICERKGMACEGLVNVKAPAVEVEDKPYRVDDALVKEEVAMTVGDKYGGDIGKQELADLTETTRTRLTGTV